MEAVIAWLVSIWEWIKGLFNRVTEAAETVLDTLTEFFTWAQDAYDAWWNTFKTFPAFIFTHIGEGVAMFFEWLPVPSFFYGAKNAFESIPPEVVYFASAFRIAEGMAMVLSAYILRFIIRRLPIVG